MNNFLKINCPFGKAKNELRKFEAENNLNLKLDNFNIFNLNLKNNDVYFSTNTGRNVEYYTGLVFEILKKSKNLNLASGGRYDNLMKQLGGPDLSAIGFALGLERILLASKIKIDTPEQIDVYLITFDEKTYEKGFRLLDSLRSNGISSDIDYENSSLKSQMRSANKAGAKFVLIIGEEELKLADELKGMLPSEEDSTFGHE